MIFQITCITCTLILFTTMMKHIFFLIYWLGPTRHCGDSITYYILTENNQVVSVYTVLHATDYDMIHFRKGIHPFRNNGEIDNLTMIRLMFITHRKPPQCPSLLPTSMLLSMIWVKRSQTSYIIIIPLMITFTMIPLLSLLMILLVIQILRNTMDFIRGTL